MITDTRRPTTPASPLTSPLTLCFALSFVPLPVCVQASIADLSRFSKLVKLRAFQPFTSAENALQNINDVSEGILNGDLRSFLESNVPATKPGAWPPNSRGAAVPGAGALALRCPRLCLPADPAPSAPQCAASAAAAGKSPKQIVGVVEPKIGTAIQDGASISCNSNETVLELCRGIRAHFTHYVSALAGGNLEKAQLGLAHSYSRAKVKFNVNRSDNMIIQAIALLDQLDKDLNTFAMRVREWYGWHFPELAKIGAWEQAATAAAVASAAVVIAQQRLVANAPLHLTAASPS
jgi:nucleolar protein 56